MSTAFSAINEVLDAKAARKRRQAFYTPLDLVKDLVEWAQVYPSGATLEPSAGDGRIIHALLAAGVARVDACEVDPEMYARCQSVGGTMIGADFLKLSPDERYDRIVMNPPFKGKTYKKHIEHAWKMLRPNGRILSLAPKTINEEVQECSLVLPGCTYATCEILEKGRFKEFGTNIEVAVVEIHKDRPGEDQECEEYSNFATYNAALTITSDRAMLDDVRKNGLFLDCRRRVAKVICETGGSCYGINWDEIQNEINPIPF